MANVFAQIKQIAPVFALVLLVALAYHNSLHDQWTLDDIHFQHMESFEDPAAVPRYFQERLRSTSGSSSNIYRPVLMVSVFIDARLFPGDKVAWHRSNIIYHGCVVLMAFLVLRLLLMRLSFGVAEASWAAFIASCLFAVHPVNSEVVNSVFNRSYILASLGCLTALWFLLRFWPDRQRLAWFAAGLIYFVSMFANEWAIVLPGIMAVLIVLLAPGSILVRIRQALPVLWMLLPMTIYLLIRDQAISESTAASVSVATAEATGRNFDLGDRLFMAMDLWTQALVHLVWPTPILVSYSYRFLEEFWLTVALQSSVLVVLVFAAIRKHYWTVLAATLFYLPLLPVSRIIGGSAFGAHLSDRYLYLPLFGIVMLLAVAMAMVVRRGYLKPLVIIGFGVCLSLMGHLWVRNDLWQSTYTLLKSDYGKIKTSLISRLYTAAIVEKQEWEEGGRICDEILNPPHNHYHAGANCGVIYMSLGRLDDAENALLRGVNNVAREVPVRLNLATLYGVTGRLQQAAEQYDLAIQVSHLPAEKEFLKGLSLISLYPGDAERIEQARQHFIRTLELQPGHRNAMQVLKQLDPSISDD